MCVFSGDNAGPEPTYEGVHATYQQYQLAYPGATVVASTIDAFVDAIDAHLSDVLPSSDLEMGDSWIMGTASEPYKTSRHRVMMRHRSECLTDSQCPSTTYEFYNFSRLLLKAGEHTWSADVKSTLGGNDAGWPKSDYFQWNNTLFQRSLHNNDMQFFISTLMEQRRWAVDVPLSALPTNHPVHIRSVAEFEALKPNAHPALDEYVKLPVNKTLQMNQFTLQFSQNGSIISLQDTSQSKLYADAMNPLGLIQYNAYTEIDFENFLSLYGACDYTKDCTWVSQLIDNMTFPSSASCTHN